VSLFTKSGVSLSAFMTLKKKKKNVIMDTHAEDFLLRTATRALPVNNRRL